MIATETLKAIVLGLFALSIVWLVWVVVKKEFDSLARVLLVMLLIGGAYLYLEHTKHPSLSFAIVRDDIFPRKPHAYSYVKEESKPGAPRMVRYIFPVPGPEGAEPGPCPTLKVTLDPNGRNYHITDVGPVNALLSDLGLPPVKAGVRELAAISGRLTDVNYYRWDDYELGILTLERGLCQDKDNLARYHCIVSLTIQGRY